VARPRPGFLLLASLLAAPLARADLSVDPKPAWAGYARHGAVTEVAVRLLAARPGRVEVSVRSDRSAATTAVDLVAAETQYAYLPVRIGEDPRLAIEVRARTGPLSARPSSCDPWRWEPPSPSPPAAWTPHPTSCRPRPGPAPRPTASAWTPRPCPGTPGL